jgi:O-antigen ligase
MSERGAVQPTGPGNAVAAAPPARRDLLSLLMAWFIPLVIVGYPLAGASAIFLPYLEPTTVTYGYRGLVAAIAAVAVMGGLLRNRVPFFPMALVLFLGAYLVRLYVDSYILGVFRADVAMLFYAGGVLPPVAAVLFAGRTVNPDELIRPVFFAALAASSLLFLIGILGLQSEIISSMEQTGGRLNLETVNSITIGHVGATLLIACIAAWYHPARLLPKVLIAAAAVVAVATMFQAGSRGPFVALAFCLIVYSVVARRWGVVFAGVIAVLTIALTSSTDQIVIFDRFTTVGWDASSAARFLTQDYAIAEFLDHPFFGSAYIEPATLDYPHNLILDTAMALGLVGLVLLGIMLFQAGREVAARLREGRFLIALLGLQFFMAAQFSGSIWGHSNLFTVIALLLVWGRMRRDARMRPNLQTISRG